MKLVTSKDQIVQNLQTLEGYRLSDKVVEKELFDRYQQRGICFVVYEQGNKTLFGPSRFIGYQANNFNKHAKNYEKSGSVTNRAIQKVLQNKFRPDARLESEFKRFCRSEGIALSSKASFGGARKFLDANGALELTNANTLSADILSIVDNVPATERDTLISARLGQGAFRAAVLKIWKGCAISGCTDQRILRASHIKPWARSSNDERLNPFNGLMLIPNLDALFDRGLISFKSSGSMIVSNSLNGKDRKVLGISSGMKIKVRPQHEPFLAYHRERIFQQ